VQRYGKDVWHWVGIIKQKSKMHDPGCRCNDMERNYGVGLASADRRVRYTILGVGARIWKESEAWRWRQ
jgi:hypothetical protein